MRRLLGLALVLGLALPTAAAARDARMDDEREGLQLRARQEAAAFSLMAAGSGAVALTAHIATPFRAEGAPQVGFVSMAISSTSLIQLAVVGGLHESLRTTKTARGLRRNLRGAAWVFGVWAVPMTLGSGVAMVLSRWEDPTIGFAWAHLSITFIATTVQLSLWADRLARVHRGEDPFLTQRGRPKARLVPAGLGLALVW